MKRFAYLISLFIVVVFESQAYDFKDEQFAYNFTTDGNVAITFLSIDADANSQYAKGEVVIPEIVNINDVTYKITEIAESAFHDCKDITAVKLTNNIAYIHDNAFQNCTSMSQLCVPTSVKKIYGLALSGCTGLEEVNIEDSNENLDLSNLDQTNNKLFADCPLKKLYLGRNYLFFGTTSPFREITTLKEAAIGNGLSEIYPYAFYGCTAIEDLKLGGSIVSIGKNAFYMCSLLKSVSFPSTLSTIDSGAFYKSGLQTVTIPKNVTKVNNCFGECTSLSELVIEDSEDVLTMYVDDFKYVEILYLGRTLSGQYAYSNHFPALKYAEIGSNVTSIGGYLFSGASLLEKIEVKSEETHTSKLIPYSQDESVNMMIIPNTITEIEYNAFASSTSLKEIELPESLTSIGNSAFGNCEKISIIKCLNTVPPTMGNNVFKQIVKDTAILQVPENSVADYSSANGWDFANITEISGVESISFESNPEFIISDGQIILSDETKNAALYSISGQKLPFVDLKMNKGMYILQIEGKAYKVVL
ncbi:MAG: leucine-rich repeat protein [Muribaculaceae bacterium]